MGGQAKKKLGAHPKPAGGGKQVVVPSTGALPGAANSHERMCWRFTHVDHDGPWGFNKVSAEVLCEILKKLASFESMTIGQIRNTSDTFKEYDLPGGLAKAANDRLYAIGRGDMTRIHRFRLTGKQRLYGVLEGNVFHVIWWDPEHEVYPSKLKHT